MSHTRSRSRLPIYDKPEPARLILARAMSISIDEAGDALVALMQGGYGIAPRNPTNGMLAAYMEATEPPRHHESVITAIAKARARWQTMLAHGTEMAMSRKRIPTSGIETEGQDNEDWLGAQHESPPLEERDAQTVPIPSSRERK